MAAAIAIALGVWWNANTVSHLFIHRPFFRRRAANAWFAALLSAALGFPQSWWRDRHIAHHRGVQHRFRLTREIAIQAALVAAMWTAMALIAPGFFAAVYLPGYVGGLLLCAVHGHYEHAAGTTSHYGWLYNALCFNDGYHVEHHRHPSAAWARLPAYRDPSSRSSAWPAPLRWLEKGSGVVLRNAKNDSRPLFSAAIPLTALERLVLRSRALQRWVLRSHARAFGVLTTPEPGAPTIAEVAIVGGGLFPRTAMILRQLLPEARITIVDASRANLDRARAFLEDDRVAFVNARFSDQTLHCDLAVFPLAFDGDRSAIYAHPPAPAVLVHDWIWRKRGTSRIVSWLLLKRVNLVTGVTG